MKSRLDYLLIFLVSFFSHPVIFSLFLNGFFGSYSVEYILDFQINSLFGLIITEILCMRSLIFPRHPKNFDLPVYQIFKSWAGLRVPKHGLGKKKLIREFRSALLTETLPTQLHYIVHLCVKNSVCTKWWDAILM